jgi:hypothetical protein
VARHITQRGTDRQLVFYSRHDRKVYLELLKANSYFGGLRMLAYCLMHNHIPSDCGSRRRQFAPSRICVVFTGGMRSIWTREGNGAGTFGRTCFTLVRQTGSLSGVRSLCWMESRKKVRDNVWEGAQTDVILRSLVSGAVGYNLVLALGFMGTTIEIGAVVTGPKGVMVGAVFAFVVEVNIQLINTQPRLHFTLTTASLTVSSTYYRRLCKQEELELHRPLGN